MTDVDPYQLLPALDAEQYAALRADIEAHGILDPVDVDEDGVTLDGHHRRQIAAELGIECPTRVVPNLTEEQKRDWALRRNLTRRHLTREQKRALVAREIADRPEESDRAIARRLGCSHTTVATVRRAISGQVGHPILTREEAEAATKRLRQSLTKFRQELLAIADVTWQEEQEQGKRCTWEHHVRELHRVSWNWIIEGISPDMSNNAEFIGGVRLLHDQWPDRAIELGPPVAA